MRSEKHRIERTVLGFGSDLFFQQIFIVTNSCDWAALSYLGVTSRLLHVP